MRRNSYKRALTRNSLYNPYSSKSSNAPRPGYRSRSCCNDFPLTRSRKRLMSSCMLSCMLCCSWAIAGPARLAGRRASNSSISLSAEGVSRRDAGRACR